jgi:predicted MFS family arabinose efflux permease
MHSRSDPPGAAPPRPPGAPALGLWPAFGLGLSVALCHGIGRFAYALIMPSMQADLGWSYAQASWMNTANALGYILGTISGFLMLAHMTARNLFRAGLLLCSASVLLMALPLGFAGFVGVRLLSGLGAAWAFSTGGALVAERYAASERHKGAATGVFFGSAGIGMIVTAAITPALFEAQGVGAWPTAWLLLGLACSVVMVWPLWETREVALPAGGVAGGIPPGMGARWGTISAHFAFALAHTGYVFFVFAWTRTQALPWFYGAGMWVLLGLGIVFSAALWRHALAQWPARRILAASCLAMGAAGALPLVHPHVAMVCISAFLVGSSLFIPPAAMVVLARQALRPHERAAGLMVFAIIFAFGQAVGSWAFGHAADRFSLSMVLAASSAGLVLAALLAWAAGGTAAAARGQRA